MNLSTLEQKAFSEFSNELFIYALERDFCDRNPSVNVLLPTLKAKLMMERKPQCQKSYIMYLNIFNSPASNIETIRHVISYLAAEYSVGQKVRNIVLCGDGQVYDFILRIKNENEEAMKWLIPYLGDFHLLFNAQPIFMRLYWSGGLGDLAKKTHSGSSLKSLGSCQHFRRTHMFLLHTWEAIQRVFIDIFLQQRTINEEIQHTTEEIDRMLLSCLKLLEGVKDHEYEKVFDSSFIEAQKEVASKLEIVEDEYNLFWMAKSNSSKTIQYWLNFLRDIKPYIGIYIANRCGNWNLRIASLKLMGFVELPVFRKLQRRCLPFSRSTKNFTSN